MGPSLWAAIDSVTPKIGCVPQTLHTWVKRHEVDSGVREGIITSELQRLKELERENKELRKANHILKLVRLSVALQCSSQATTKRSAAFFPASVTALHFTRLGSRRSISPSAQHST